MKTFDWSFQKSFEFVKEKRGCIAPHSKRSLQDYEKYLQKNG
jgi:hypothetical protein